MRNQDQLNTLLRDLYDPSSPRYHQFLSVDEFAQQFGPTTDQQQAVKDNLTQQGFSVTRIGGAGFGVTVGGPVTTVFGAPGVLVIGGVPPISVTLLSASATAAIMESRI